MLDTALYTVLLDIALDTTLDTALYTPQHALPVLMVIPTLCNLKYSLPNALRISEFLPVALVTSFYNNLISTLQQPCT